MEKLDLGGAFSKPPPIPPTEVVLGLLERK